MSPVHLRNVGIPRNQPEDRQGLFRTRRLGHLGHSGGWQETEGNHNHSAIHLPAQQKHQTRGLEGYVSSSSASPTAQRSCPRKHGQQQVQPRITLGRARRKFTEGMYQRDILHRSYGSQKTGIPSSFTPFRQKISDQESPFFTISGGFQEKSRIQGQEKDLFQQKKERFRPNDPEAVGLEERSTQEPEIVVNTSRISIPNNRNITPTQNEHSVFTPESNLNSAALWLQMSQYAEKTQKQFAELQESHLRMEKITASMDKIVKSFQESHSKLRNASEEANKRLKPVFEKQNHCKRDRDCLDKDLNKLFNVYQNMKPQPQGHFLDNPYHQDIKPDALLENKERSQ
ncbi:hypothetical protein O181_045195 [Austropuccinia psidii MF-1]|uniref:Uncharacterized protein n=1 Tax=Austropuccinia psidii MF-1 TaxID=1389203 RepID=A0A9Q3HKY8_9BASI|nr:hypothetical protein [Austropuccinia psidii MF-1]